MICQSANGLLCGPGVQAICYLFTSDTSPHCQKPIATIIIIIVLHLIINTFITIHHQKIIGRTFSSQSMARSTKASFERCKFVILKNIFLNPPQQQQCYHWVYHMFGVCFSVITDCGWGPYKRHGTKNIPVKKYFPYDEYIMHVWHCIRMSLHLPDLSPGHLLPDQPPTPPPPSTTPLPDTPPPPRSTLPANSFL